MTKLVFDRDGTLFDTCELNFCAYVAASEALGLHIDDEALRESICAGETFSTFRIKVWGGNISRVGNELKNLKVEYFSRNLSLARPNPELIKLIEECENVVFLATRATLESTKMLLERFKVQILWKNVFSTQSHPGRDKLSIMLNILESEGGIPAAIKLIDDSFETINAVSAAGFSSELYPHYCSIKG
jgi:beta-phosphoglucomutase-like phosphatase (HAD superfamily)